MSSPKKINVRPAEREHARSNSEKEEGARGGVSSSVGWWLAPALTLAFACAIVTMIVHNRSALSKSTASNSPRNQPRTTSAQAVTNQPGNNQSETNKPSADATAEMTLKLSAEAGEFLQRGEFAQAARKFQEALEINPSDEDLHYNLGITLTKLGQIEEAKKHYEEALKIFPDYVEVHNNLGNLLMNENDLAKAIEHFQEAIRLKPDNALAHNNLGTALGRQGKVKEALAEFAEAVKLQPTYVEARVNLANAFITQGQFDQAITELSEALRLAPNFPPAINALRRAKEKQASSVVPR